MESDEIQDAAAEIVPENVMRVIFEAGRATVPSDVTWIRIEWGNENGPVIAQLASVGRPEDGSAPQDDPGEADSEAEPIEV
jgi:hypothetical protein